MLVRNNPFLIVLRSLTSFTRCPGLRPDISSAKPAEWQSWPPFGNPGQSLPGAERGAGLPGGCGVCGKTER